MSDAEDLREEAKRLNWEAKHPQFEEECQHCGEVDKWELTGGDRHYGADADGRRGVPLKEYTCTCGNVVEVIG